jgi:CheY-like chemotaxis protein
MLSKVFDMFTQVDPSLEKTRGGLGIGLTLVKRIVELHGGHVEAHSDGAGAGAELIVRLPSCQSARQPDGECVIAPAENTAGSRRVLVVDDNHDAAATIEKLLQLSGHEVRTAHDGLEALRAAEEFRPDVALLDLGMPRMNGYDTARALRDHGDGKNIALIALTGWGQDEDRRRSQEAGFSHHLVKPVAPATLLQLLAALPLH